MVKKYQLKNGLKVLLVESHKSPVVSTQMWVNTGSADERSGEEGISHFIEHLVFKGTKKFGVGEIAKQVESSGGELNAYTSFDQTVFYVTISKNFLGTSLEVISEMMGYPRFDPEEIDREREVVIEEIKRSHDSPHRQASQTLFSTAYRKHAYGIPVIGYEEVVRNISVKKLRKYYEDRYSPANMTLLVAGDFKSSSIKKDIEKYFGGIPKTKVRKVTRKKETARKRSKVVTKQIPFNESFLYFSWPAPNAKSKKTPALDLFSLILGQGESSRLVHKLHSEKALVNSVGAGAFTPKDPGEFVISMTLNNKNLDAVLEETLAVLEKFLKEPASNQELLKAIRSIESDKFYSLQTVDGLTQLVGNFNFYFGDPTYFDKQLKDIEKLTTKDLLKQARNTMDPSQLNLIYLSKEVGSEVEDKLNVWIKKYKTIYKKAKTAKTYKVNKPRRKKISWSLKNLSAVPKEPKLHKLESGARLITLQSKDSPVVSIRSAILGGLRSENLNQQGVNELLARSWTAGTELRSESVIMQQIEALAGRVSAFGGKNTTGLGMTALTAFTPDIFDIYKEIYTNPLFAEEAVEREKALIIEQLKNRADNPAQLCMLNMMRELFGSHPYHRDPLGTEDSITTLTRASVKSQYQKIINPKNICFAAVGDVSLDFILEEVEKLTSMIKWTDEAWPPVEQTKLVEDRESFTKLDKEQSHIVLAYPGLLLNDPKRKILDILQAVLAGQGGRLFVELRDKESLAYTVSPLRMEGIDAGYFGTYIGCSPEKQDKAITMMREELAKLCDDLISEEELQRAKKYIIGKHDISMQRNASIATDMMLNEIYGLDFDEFRTYSDSIESVSREDVRGLAKQIFAQKSVLSIVGK